MSAPAERIAALEAALAVHTRLVARLRSGADTATALAEFDAALPSSPATTTPRRRARAAVSESSPSEDASAGDGSAIDHAKEKGRPGEVVACDHGRGKAGGECISTCEGAVIAGDTVKANDDRSTRHDRRGNPRASVAKDGEDTSTNGGASPSPAAQGHSTGGLTTSAVPQVPAPLAAPATAVSQPQAPPQAPPNSKPAPLKVSSKPVRKERVTLVAKCTEPTPGQTRYWTQSEHDRFLEAVRQHGEKAYVAISNYVETRTPKQVRTHAQKFQMKMARLAKGGGLVGGAPPPHTRGSGKAAKLKAAKAKAEAAKAASAAAASLAQATVGALPTPAPTKAPHAPHAPVVSTPSPAVQPPVVAPSPLTAPVVSAPGAPQPPMPVPMSLSLPTAAVVPVAGSSASTILPAAAATAAAVVSQLPGEPVVSPLATSIVDGCSSVEGSVEPTPLTIVASVADDVVDDSTNPTSVADAAEAVMLLEGMSSDEDMASDGGDVAAADAYMSYIGGGGRDLEDLEDVAVLATSPFGDGGEEWLTV